MTRSGSDPSCPRIRTAPRTSSAPSRILFHGLCLSAVLLASFPPCAAQNAEIVFRQISTDQGLSQSLVLCMLQDRHGFMWIGTEDGLNRYDGAAFITYRHNPLDGQSLSNSYIWSLFEDHEGMIWIGTWGGGLNRYDPVRDRFTRYVHDPEDSTSISHGRVTSVQEDDAGALWICTAGGGLNRFDRTTQRFTRMSTLFASLPRAQRADLFCMLRDRDGSFWIGTYFSGLLHYDPRRGTIEEFRHIPRDPFSISDDRIVALCQEDNGDLWIGTWGGGLNLLHRRTKTFTRYRHSPRDPSSLPGDIVRSLMRDLHGDVWVGTVGAGLARFDSERRTFVRFRHTPLIPTALSDNVVTSMLADAGGVLWFGTANGISISSPYAHKFTLYRSGLGQPGSLQGKRVFAMCTDSLGHTWIGTEDGGLSRFDPRSRRFTNYRHDPRVPTSLPGDYVASLMTDSRGDVWIGTYGGGLARFDRGTRSFRRYGADPAAPQRRLNAYISSIAEDRDGNIWIGTWIVGVAVIDRAGHILRVHTHKPDDPGSIPDNDIRCVVRDRSGTIWVGTSKGGVARYDAAENRFQRFQQREDGRGPANNYVQSITEDSRGRLWFATFGAGVSMYDPGTTAWSHYAAPNGLPNNVAYGILEDGHRRLWISTNEGISCLDPERASFRNYTRHDGLQADEFNYNAYCHGPGGTLFFGGINGFNIIDPDRIIENAHTPPVVITAFKVFNEAVPLGVAPFAAQHITLDHDANFVSIEYAALDYALPGRNRYAYRLEGLDRRWVEAGTRRMASYTNLEPGTYTFRVRGSNNDGLWNEEGAVVSITITPPFWQTWWFRILAGALLVAVLSYGYHLRVESLLNVERLRLRIASDLHDEIGSSLASIAVLADLVRKRTALPAAEADRLLDISRAARSTSDALRDIVWFVNPEHDGTGNIIDRLRGISATLLAGIQTSIRVDGPTAQVRLPMTFRRDLVLTFKEILSNIVRHADADKVEIEIAVHRRRFRLEVRDNGKGFDPQAHSGGNGLATLRRRAAAMGAHLEIRSASGQGTAVCLDVKLP